MSNSISLQNNCILCPRKCSVDRRVNVGFCGQTNTVTLARAALHQWEEPCISGCNGSGAVFFCGCNLRCAFCQNSDLANSRIGKEVSIERLSEIFLELQNQNAHNINLITAGHFIPQVATALSLAKDHGLTIPVVYNTGTYEYADSIKLLDGLVDIYMPDMKYYDSTLADRLSHAPDYFEIAGRAIDEMYRQVGRTELITIDNRVYTENDSNVHTKNNHADESSTILMKKGVLVRHLVLPNHTKDSRNILDYLYSKYGDNIYISIMNQYTPMPGISDAIPDMPELHRTLTSREYEKVVNYAIELGITNAFIQEGETYKDSFIPIWDYTGL